MPGHGGPIRRIDWLAVAVLVLLGCIFRVANVDDLLYWHDETYTSFRLHGYPPAEMYTALSQAPARAPNDVLRFQRPDGRGSVATTVALLAREDAQHPPLYYGLLHPWIALFGSQPAGIRALSVLVSLLLLPAVAWLCRELSAPPAAAPLGVALLAVSPFEVRYAQEAREYILWGLLILLSSATLARALL